MCLTESELTICNESAEEALLIDAAHQKSCFQTFPTNRESCMVSKTKTKGQMKTQKKNAPSVCQYWRKGRMSGKRPPSRVLAPFVARSFHYLLNCAFRRRVCGPMNSDMWDGRCSCSIFPLSLEIYFLKPKGIVISRKPQSALKLPASWNCFLALTQVFC